MNLIDIKNKAKEWNKLKNDTARFEYLLANKGIFILELDNDLTFADYNLKTLKEIGLDLDEAQDILPELNSFDDFLGWHQGVITLLEVIGIDAESV